MSYHTPKDYGLTAAYLRTLYRLDADGVLWHRRRPVSMFTSGRHSVQQECNRWNTRFADKEVNPGASKYKRTSVLCPAGIMHSIFVHHIIDCMRTGVWPKQMIDHVNGDTLDNSRRNHRPVTDSQSMINRGRPRNNTSKVVGVYRCAGKWRAKLVKDGVYLLDRYFIRKQDAVAARRVAEHKHFGEYQRKD